MWKRVMACAAAAAIGMTSALTVMAAPVAEATIDAARTGNITIYKYDTTTAQANGTVKSYVSTGKANAEVEDLYGDYAIAGVEFSYLKVGDFHTRTIVDGSTGSAEVELLYGLNASVVEAFSAIGITEADAVYEANGLSYYESDALVDHLSDALATDSVAVKNALEQYMQESAGRAKVVTNEAGKAQIANVPLGLYLVVETAVPEDVVITVDPFFVSLPMTDLEGDHWLYDVTVYPKNQTGDPTLTKEVAELAYAKNDDVWEPLEANYADTATASDGDTLSYHVTSKLPKITSSATFLTTYTFVDTLSKGFSYQKSDVTMTWYTPAGDKVTVWDETSGKFQVSYANGADSAEVMTIQMTESGLAEINPLYSEYTVVVEYAVTLNSDGSVIYGDVGNPNRVELTWKRTNRNLEDHLEEDCLVYTYGVDLTKRFRSGQGSFSEVKFSLQNETDGFFVTANKSADGVYYVTETVGATEAEGTLFSPAADGTLRIFGLEDDTYVLTETETAAGYVLLKDAIQIVISSTEGQHCRVGSATVNGNDVTMLEVTGSSNALVPLTVVNEKGFQMPMTGDAGLFLLPMLGLAGSGVLLIIGMAQKKRSAV